MIQTYDFRTKGQCRVTVHLPHGDHSRTFDTDSYIDTETMMKFIFKWVDDTIAEFYQ